MTHRRRRKCRSCGELFRADARNLRHQLMPLVARPARWRVSAGGYRSRRTETTSEARRIVNACGHGV